MLKLSMDRCKVEIKGKETPDCVYSLLALKAFETNPAVFTERSDGLECDSIPGLHREPGLFTNPDNRGVPQEEAADTTKPTATSQDELRCSPSNMQGQLDMNNG